MFGSAFSMFDFIRFLDRKKGPKNEVILLEINEESFKPKTLNTKRRDVIIKNWIKYFVNFICAFLDNLLVYLHS